MTKSRWLLLFIVVGVVGAFLCYHGLTGVAPQEGGSTETGGARIVGGTANLAKAQEGESREAADNEGLNEEAQELIAEWDQKATKPHFDHALKELLKIKSRDGRDNALIHYELAAWIWPGVPPDEAKDALRQVLREGWSEETEVLRPWLAAWQPAFGEIRKGVALDHAEGIGSKDGPATGVPNFLTAQFACKALCAEGRRLEYEEKYEDALETYFTALAMGRDYASPGNGTFGHRISLAIQSMALTQIARLCASGNIDREGLLRAIGRLRHVENTGHPPENWHRVMTEIRITQIKRLQAAPRKRRADIYIGSRRQLPPLPEFWDSLAEGPRGWEFYTRAWTKRREVKSKRQREDRKVAPMISNLGRAAADAEEVAQRTLAYLQAPWWERGGGQGNAVGDTADLHPLARSNLPHPPNEKARYLAALSRLRSAQIVAALQIRFLDTGAYPENLDAVASHFDGTLPADPFTGRAFRYRSEPGAEGYLLWSIGPDGEDEQGEVRYDDASNASRELGRGDIVTESRRSPKANAAQE